MCVLLTCKRRSPHIAQPAALPPTPAIASVPARGCQLWAVLPAPHLHAALHPDVPHADGAVRAARQYGRALGVDGQGAHRVLVPTQLGDLLACMWEGGAGIGEAEV